MDAERCPKGNHPFQDSTKIEHRLLIEAQTHPQSLLLLGQHKLLNSYEAWGLINADEIFHAGRQSQSTLHKLPQNLINSIFDQVKQASGLKAIGQLRLVCKAWQACVSHYPAEVTCRFNNDALKIACRILPNMTTISLLDTEYAGIDVGALRTCSYLTAIHLAINSPLGCQDYTEPVQLQDLPASVVSISVDKVLVDSNAYQLMSSAQAAAVKSLQVDRSDYLPGNVWSWLEYLPNVEVSSYTVYACNNTFVWQSFQWWSEWGDVLLVKVDHEQSNLSLEWGDVLLVKVDHEQSNLSLAETKLMQFIAFQVLHVGQPSHWWSREFDDLFKRGLGRYDSQLRICCYHIQQLLASFCRDCWTRIDSLSVPDLNRPPFRHLFIVG